MKIEEQKKAVRSGYDMEIIPSDLATYGGEAKKILDDLQSRNERMFLAFRVLLCVNGCGTISYDGGSITFYKGDCIFVPADSEVLTLHGQAQFLDVRG